MMSTSAALTAGWCPATGKLAAPMPDRNTKVIGHALAACHGGSMRAMTRHGQVCSSPAWPDTKPPANKYLMHLIAVTGPSWLQDASTLSASCLAA